MVRGVPTMSHEARDQTRQQGKGLDFGPTATVYCNHEPDGTMTCLLNNGKAGSPTDDVEPDEVGVVGVDSIYFNRLAYTDDGMWGGSIHGPSSPVDGESGFDVELNFDNEQVECKIEENRDERLIECSHIVE